MYPNLEAEIQQKKITKQELANLTGISPIMLSLKLNGKYDLSLKECVLIKSALATDKRMEHLFAINKDRQIEKGGEKNDKGRIRTI